MPSPLVSTGRSNNSTAHIAVLMLTAFSLKGRRRQNISVKKERQLDGGLRKKMKRTLSRQKRKQKTPKLKQETPSFVLHCTHFCIAFAVATNIITTTQG